MIDINKHRDEYFYNYLTVIKGLIPESICDKLAKKANDAINSGFIDLVNHENLGTDAVSDLGGKYLHHIFKGSDIREHIPELECIYHYNTNGHLR